MAGAEVVLVDGLISEAAGMAGEKARAEGWFDLSTFKEPYRTDNYIPSNINRFLLPDFYQLIIFLHKQTNILDVHPFYYEN